MDNLDTKSESGSSQGADMRSQEDENFRPEQNIEVNEQSLVKQSEKVPQFEGELMQKFHKQYQIIYITAYTPTYRQRLQQLAHQYSCDLTFIKNNYIVSCKDKSKHKQWTECKQKIRQYFDQILYVKVEETDRRFKMYNSPEVNRYAKQRQIYFCLFNSEVYVHSDSYTFKQLQDKKKEIYKYANIYSVCFLRRKAPEAIDIEIANFYKTVIRDYYAQRFQNNNIVVELNKMQKSFYILGKPGSSPFQMMQAKKTVKNLIEGLTIVAFKNTQLDVKQQAKLKQYVKRISKFPITYGKLSQSIVILVSKDNILRELLKKTDKIINKVGITDNTSIGIFIPFCNSRDEKKQQVNKICKQMGYDYWQNWGVRYFRTMIQSDGQARNQVQTLQLIIQIIIGFMDIKDKYEVMKDKKQPQVKMDALKKKQLEQQSKFAYMLSNTSKDSKQMTKVLRRDVMEDQVMMKKRYNAIYSIIDGNEIGPFYIQKAQYDKGVGRGEIKLIKIENLKKGEYFETFFKINDYSIDTKNLQEIETVFIEELKKLKQAAKSDKLQGKSFDKNKKLAHMIKRLIIVF